MSNLADLSILREYQKEVYIECLNRESVGISVPTGGGKTLIALALGLNVSGNRPILIVVPVSLVVNWILEINSFFPHIRYETFLNTDFKNKRDMDNILSL